MIFCVEDDDSIRNMVVYTLKASGFGAEGFPNSQSFFHRLAEIKPKLIMLDIMLPGEDGETILRRLRSREDTMDIPIIMATAKGTEFDKVSMLDLGADDYLVKPFGMMEMVSRVKAVLRRTGSRVSGQILSIGVLKMDMGRHLVTVNNTPVELTLKEYDLLHTLMESPGQVFSRDEILHRVWGGEYFGETRTVDVHIGTLRAKLKECGAYIRTVRGVGYTAEAIV